MTRDELIEELMKFPKNLPVTLRVTDYWRGTFSSKFQNVNDVFMDLDGKEIRLEN